MSTETPSPVTEGDTTEKPTDEPARCDNGMVGCPGTDLDTPGADPDALLCFDCHRGLARIDERPIDHRPTTTPYSGF